MDSHFNEYLTTTMILLLRLPHYYDYLTTTIISLI